MFFSFNALIEDLTAKELRGGHLNVVVCYVLFCNLNCPLSEECTEPDQILQRGSCAS